MTLGGGVAFLIGVGTGMLIVFLWGAFLVVTRDGK